jgi:hypothetical protein
VHAAEHDRPFDLAQDVLGVDTRGRPLRETQQDMHLPFPTFFSLGNLPLRLEERVVQRRVRTGEHGGHESIQSAAPPPMVSGLAGLGAVPHGNGPSYATRPKLEHGGILLPKAQG